MKNIYFLCVILLFLSCNKNKSDLPKDHDFKITTIVNDSSQNNLSNSYINSEFQFILRTLPDGFSVSEETHEDKDLGKVLVLSIWNKEKYVVGMIKSYQWSKDMVFNIGETNIKIDGKDLSRTDLTDISNYEDSMYQWKTNSKHVKYEFMNDETQLIYEAVLDGEITPWFESNFVFPKG